MTCYAPHSTSSPATVSRAVALTLMLELLALAIPCRAALAQGPALVPAAPADLGAGALRNADL